ncbi:MAG: FAD:protein FMN transferase [Candidatus Limnocylindrales bacterium]
MGSALRLQVLESPATTAAGCPGRHAVPTEALWARVTAEFEATEQALSRFRDQSDLTRLNRAAGDRSWHVVGARLYRTLAASARAYQLTTGRFEPRILDDLERLGYAGAVLAPRAAGTAARTRPWVHRRPWLEREPRRRAVRLTAPLDSGGIGKGLALRWAWRTIVADLGDRAALLEAGGDLVCRGPGPDGRAWLVGLEDPLGGLDPLAVIALEQGAICTSSVAVTRWRAPDGRLVHHLIDPRTGEPGGEGLLAVTVAAPDPAWAEVWSKALFLAGAGAIGEEARARGMAAWWAEADGSLHCTPAARQRTAWTAV